MLLTLGIYAYSKWEVVENRYTLLNSYSIPMTNRRYGLMKKSPTTHFRKLAAMALRDAFQALDHVDCVCIAVQWEGCEEPYEICSYGPTPPDWNREEYYSVLSWLSRDITVACLQAYTPQFERTKTSKPYRFRRKGVLYFVNYGGKGVIAVDSKNREIRYDYTHLSARKFSRTLAARYMARYIDWDHRVYITEASDKDGLRRALENLEIDVRLGGGDLLISSTTRNLLSMEPPEEVPLPF